MNRVVVFLVALAFVAVAVTVDAPGFTTAAFTSGSSNSASTVSASNDWTPPVVDLVQPASPIKDTATLTATATDSESGIASVSLEYQRVDATSWIRLCTVNVAPYSCAFNTKLVADGSYNLRAIATDVVGNTATSATVTNIVIDNTVSSVALADPGAFLRGTVSLAANAAAGSGIVSVTIQRALAGETTWAAVCSISASPYECTWDSATVPDGLYDFRAVLLDGAGKTTISALVANRQVDNTMLRGADIQAVNAHGTAGRLGFGDVISYTFPETISLASVLPGWDGSATAVSVRLQDGNIMNAGDSNDFVDIQRSGSQVNLGSVNLRSNFIKEDSTAVFAGTMTASTATVNGVAVTVVRVTLGFIESGGFLRNSKALVAMSWSPSALVRDAAGNPSSTAPVAETGDLDLDF